MGTPSEELFLCILMINAMTSIPELETTRGLVAQDLAKSQPDSTGKTTYKSSDINVALDTAQTLVDADGKTTDLVFAAQGSRPPKQPFKPSHRPQCTNPQCSRPSGHQIEYCVSPGGGMAGKTIAESRAARIHDRSGVTRIPGLTTKPAPSHFSVVTDKVSGHAYVIDLTTNTVVGNLPAKTHTKAHPEFAGLASDPISNLPGVSEADRIEYEGWLAFEDLKTNVNWNERRREIDTAAIATEPMNQPTRSKLSTNYSPFLCDTGATVHITPERNDFLTLRPIPPRFEMSNFKLAAAPI
ncbi:hypothetical protein GGU11DRAFT_812744 [Lentinula aff. detonsa]|nr:hypothetical protein GGU11DRAFT_812744 [Lentinula aff. detonsa]